LHGLIFLGTPHPIAKRPNSPAQDLEALISSYGRLSTDTLRKMNEEVAALWNVSSKFQETSFRRTIVSTFETALTRYHSGSFLPRRRKVVSQILDFSVQFTHSNVDWLT
jgi:hypothetical protein